MIRGYNSREKVYLRALPPLITLLMETTRTQRIHEATPRRQKMERLPDDKFPARSRGGFTVASLDIQRSVKSQAGKEGTSKPTLLHTHSPKNSCCQLGVSTAEKSARTAETAADVKFTCKRQVTQHSARKQRTHSAPTTQLKEDRRWNDCRKKSSPSQIPRLFHRHSARHPARNNRQAPQRAR